MWVFGEQEFDDLIQSQRYFLIEFEKNTPFKLFGHFGKFYQAHPIYSDYSKFPEMENYDVDQFKIDIAEINDVINGPRKYEFISKLRNNTVFMINEFKRFCFLIRDIYLNGTFHYACTFWHNGMDYIMAHPGNHLLFTLQMLNRPIRSLHTVLIDDYNKFSNKFNYNIIKEFRTVKDVNDTIDREYKAWLQDGSILLPAIVVEGDSETWRCYDRSGFLRWPRIDFVDQWAKKQWWWDILPDLLDGTQPISDYIIIKKHFENKDILFGNLVGFLLNSDRISEDDNFKTKSYDSNNIISINDYLTKNEQATTRRYYGNRFTECDNFLK